MENAFLIKFMRTLVGQEGKLVKALEEESTTSLFFKVFGKYDVLEISRFTDLNEAIRGNSDGRILSINAVPCFCWNKKQNEFWTKLNRSLTPVVALLKLQDPVFRYEGLSGLKKVADYLETFGSSKGFTLIGMGYYELVLCLPEMNFDDIFNFTSNLRKLRINDVFEGINKNVGRKGLFADTTTVPVISYKNVIDPCDWGKLHGKKITPIVKIKTTPGKEDFVIKKWPVGWRQLLGTEDLVLSWDKEEDLDKFVPQLISFRDNWVKNYAVIDTSTRLIGHEAYKPSSTSIAMLPASDGPLPPIMEQLRDLGKSKNANPFVITELINIIGMINTNLGNRSQLSTYSDIVHSFKYLNSLLDEYEKVTSHNQIIQVALLEDYLLDYANCVYAAIGQHFPTKDYSEFSTNAIPYAGSLSRIVTAISIIPVQIFKVISKSPPPAKLVDKATKRKASDDLKKTIKDYASEWQGFLFLNLAEGYKVVDQSEIFYTPYKDIFKVLNWITLSHEIAHAYYYRVNFELIEDNWLNDIAGSLDTKDDYCLYHSNVAELCSEFFAHWFDYVHFFDRKTDFYFWSIWRTWVKLPRIHHYKNNYWIRTVFIKLCSKWKSIKPQIQDIFFELDPDEAFDALLNLILNEVDEVSAFLRLKFPDEFDSISIDSNDRETIAKIVLYYHDFIFKFEDEYINNEIIKAINRPYTTMKQDMTDIYSGIPVTKPVKNPFLLLRNILHIKFESNDKAPLSDNATIAFIYSLWETSRDLRRKEGF